MDNGNGIRETTQEIRTDDWICSDALTRDEEDPVEAQLDDHFDLVDVQLLGAVDSAVDFLSAQPGL